MLSLLDSTSVFKDTHNVTPVSGHKYPSGSGLLENTQGQWKIFTRDKCLIVFPSLCCDNLWILFHFVRHCLQSTQFVWSLEKYSRIYPRHSNRLLLNFWNPAQFIQNFKRICKQSAVQNDLQCGIRTNQLHKHKQFRIKRGWLLQDLGHGAKLHGLKICFQHWPHPNYECELSLVTCPCVSSHTKRTCRSFFWTKSIPSNMLVFPCLSQKSPFGLLLFKELFLIWICFSPVNKFSWKLFPVFISVLSTEKCGWFEFRV